MTAAEFKAIRQALKLSGKELAFRIRKSVEETFEYETGKKSIPETISKYLMAVDPRSNQE